MKGIKLYKAYKFDIKEMMRHLNQTYHPISRVLIQKIQQKVVKKNSDEMERKHYEDYKEVKKAQNEESNGHIIDHVDLKNGDQPTQNMKVDFNQDENQLEPLGQVIKYATDRGLIPAPQFEYQGQSLQSKDNEKQFGKNQNHKQTKMIRDERQDVQKNENPLPNRSSKAEDFGCYQSPRISTKNKIGKNLNTSESLNNLFQVQQEQPRQAITFQVQEGIPSIILSKENIELDVKNQIQPQKEQSSWQKSHILDQEQSVENKKEKEQPPSKISRADKEIEDPQEQVEIITTQVQHQFTGVEFVHPQSPQQLLPSQNFQRQNNTSKHRERNIGVFGGCFSCSSIDTLP
eukprot:TRINITY_DN2737_c0_g1_i5.p1 TRINITY_DN2737_c0_g1~~TRINITY_DN2737_c0_g1_i5.p1  ORF type:complete len:365 (-),score=34.84 TRINITY_DN2737_c0_g1_i5:259-1296(-)